MTETILCSQDGAVATLTFNRPAVLNAIDSSCLKECLAALDGFADDESVRVIVLRGTGGKAFTSGADIREIAKYGPREMARYNRLWLDWFDALERIPKPVIASVEGWATGGGTEMSLACDFVLCADTAKFGLAEINIGVIPGAGAAVRLTRWLGRLRAKELVMLGEVIEGPQAVAWHLATRSFPAADLASETRSFAAKLAEKAPLALAAAKSSINIGSEAALSVALEYELRDFLLLFDTEDQKEGMAAFLEKRKPVYRGK